MEVGKKKYASPELTVGVKSEDVFLASDPAKDDFSWDDDLLGG